MDSAIPEAFHSYYAAVYKDRWADLLKALTSQEIKAARPNAFSSAASTKAAEGAAIARDAEGLLTHYIMDPASIAVAQALDVQPGESVLDMCAAPGGKTLVLAEALQGEGELIANEMSAARRGRLTKVLQQYIPRHKRDHIRVTGKDGGLFVRTHKEHFDKILVDAPCSGERHLLQTPSELQEWNVKRGRRLQQRQYALLSAALLAVKPGGVVVYGTCSINPEENDGVVQRLLDKKDSFKTLKADDWKPLKHLPGQPEGTLHGYSYLPDRGGWGPIYFAVLRRN